jgi:hypothetical protein
MSWNLSQLSEKFLIFFLSKWAYFLPTLIDLGHGEEFVVELVQQVLPRSDGTRHVWIQPSLGSIMEWERKKPKMHRLFRNFLKFEGGTDVFEFLHMAIRIFENWMEKILWDHPEKEGLIVCPPTVDWSTNPRSSSWTTSRLA